MDCLVLITPYYHEYVMLSIAQNISLSPKLIQSNMGIGQVFLAQKPRNNRLHINLL